MPDINSARRSTRLRRAILELLSRSPRPLSAPEIHRELHRQGETQSLSTVYRALDSFTASGKLTRGSLRDIAHYQLNDGRHMHFAVCRECKSAVPLKGCPMASVQVSDESFEVEGHRLELFGLCGVCRERSSKAGPHREKARAK